MLNSLVSLIFGNGTAKDENHNPNVAAQEASTSSLKEVDPFEKDIIHVTSLSPSVTGDTNGSIIVVSTQSSNSSKKRSKSGKRNRNQHRNANKHHSALEPVDVPEEQRRQDGLKSTDNASESDDDWIILQNEDDEIELLSHKDSEEEPELCPPTADLPVAETAVVELDLEVENTANSGNVVAVLQQQRRQQLIDSQALYNGPRHKQQRNYLQRKRNAAVRGTGNAAKLTAVKAASVERDVPLCLTEADEDSAAAELNMTQSLYFGDVYGHNSSIDESWFVTPPPCFTSIGPINMVSSPFENLLIEHPSMSVYHSIRSLMSAERAELEASEQSPEEQQQVLPSASRSPGAAGPRVERYKVAQLKQELFARNAQKVNVA